MKQVVAQVELEPGVKGYFSSYDNYLNGHQGYTAILENANVFPENSSILEHRLLPHKDCNYVLLEVIVTPRTVKLV